MKEPKKESVILYSGGLDSSAVAAVYGHRGYDTLHLLTFDNGAQSNTELSEVKLPLFQSRFPNTKFIHETLPVKYLFKRVALDSLEEDFREYSTNLVCVGCKMAMHAEAAVYALDKGIDELVDGFVERQDHFPEQDKLFVEEMKRFHEQYGITYENPLYHRIKSKEDVKSLLFRYNLPPKSIEPNCLFGGTFSPAKKKEIKAYFRKKRPLLEEYIQEHLDEKTPLKRDGLFE